MMLQPKPSLLTLHVPFTFSSSYFNHNGSSVCYPFVFLVETSLSLKASFNYVHHFAIKFLSLALVSCVVQDQQLTLLQRHERRKVCMQQQTMDEEFPGSLRTSASLALRFGQTLFSTASLLFMCLDVEFYSYTAFCFSVTVMGLVVPWGMTLVIVDTYSVFVRFLPRQPRIVVILVTGDLALSYLSLAAACSTASTTMLLRDANGSYCPVKLCTRYQLSAAMAFLSWFLSMGSCLFNLWLLPSL